MTKKPPEKLGPQTRTISLRLDSSMMDMEGMMDMQARTMRFPFSSEAPCDMWYGTEVLSHAPGAVRDKGVRQSTMPLLFNHCPDDLLGVVESIEIGSNNRGYANVRFGKDERGDWALQQVADEIMTAIGKLHLTEQELR